MLHFLNVFHFFLLLPFIIYTFDLFLKTIQQQMKALNGVFDKKSYLNSIKRLRTKLSNKNIEKCVER